MALRAFTTISPLSFSLPTVSLPSLKPSLANLAYQKKLALLIHSMEHNSKYDAVWGNYSNLLTMVHPATLPQELHEQVLRKCVPNLRRVRFHSRVAAEKHPFESRFRAVMSNMLLAGYRPSLDTYHFIMHHFSTCGNFVGTMRLYNELPLQGLSPSATTYTMCFQALAQRLALPVRVNERDRTVARVQAVFDTLIGNLRQTSILVTSVNVDLILRILKETMDYKVFDEMMKWSYGIDLDNPDRPVLDINACHSEFTTAALNTTLDILGRFGMVSKMIQSFEVLTTALPNASQVFSDSFEDEDDFGEGSRPEAPPYQPPSASPNTTTYTILLKHLGMEGQTTLLRHYFLDAMAYDHEVTLSTYKSHQLIHGPMPPPQFSLKHGMLMSLYGHANRSNHIGLMKWLNDKLPQLIKRRRVTLGVFFSFREKCLRFKWFEYLPRFIPGSDGLEREYKWNQRVQTLIGRDKAIEVLAAAERKALEPHEDPYYNRRIKMPFTSFLDPQVDQPQLLVQPSSSHLDVDLHLAMLKRDIQQFTQFQQLLKSSISRGAQLVKQKLGRRVWRGKTIWTGTHSWTKVTRDRWKEIANMQERRGHPLPGLLGVRNPGVRHNYNNFWRYWHGRREARKAARPQGKKVNS